MELNRKLNSQRVQAQRFQFKVVGVTLFIEPLNPEPRTVKPK